MGGPSLRQYLSDSMLILSRTINNLLGITICLVADFDNQPPSF
jgi:hypothetical protein